MFHLKKSLLGVAALAAIASAPSAFAVPGVDIGIMGGANYAMPSNSAGITKKIGLGGGASIGVGPLEISAIYNQYKIEASGLTVTTNYLDIPVLLRIGAGPISLGLGGFYSPFLSGTTNVGGTVTADANYGATGSLRFTVPVAGFFIDGRYNLGLNDDGGSKLSGASVYLGWNIL